MKILLGLTGSVASVLNEKLAKELKSLGEVNVVLTERSRHFVYLSSLKDSIGLDGKIYTDDHEWTWSTKTAGGFSIPSQMWKKDDPILHINLRNQSSALVIAPCSANTLAKLANGMCDNLLTSIARAWDMTRPIFVAPSMNTEMWNHPITKMHINILESFGYRIIMPQEKMLACKTQGMGAMAEINDIVEAVKESLRWDFPLESCTGIPTDNHPGSFLCKRKHHTHTGVDMYANFGQEVFSVEPGTVVGIEHFTGPQDNMPWWNNTDCVLVEGATGVICYGEISPNPRLKVGDKIKRGHLVGTVLRVLLEGKERPDIEGHKPTMLHMEIYPHGKYTAFEEYGEKTDDFAILRDPTPHLINARNSPKNLLYNKNKE